MRGEVDLLSADAAFSPTALVIGNTMISTCYLGIEFLDVATVWALFVGVADGLDVEGPSLEVIVVAFSAEERSVT